MNVSAESIVAILKSHRYSFADEKELQAGIWKAIENDFQHIVEREFELGDAGVIDFYRVDGLGIEVKIKGSRVAVMRQLARYAKRDEIKRLILVTSRSQLRAMPPELNGKKITVVYIGGIA